MLMSWKCGEEGWGVGDGSVRSWVLWWWLMRMMMVGEDDDGGW